MPNVHSHAFQRLLVGRTEETRGGDTFWSWRETMYRVAQALEPEMVHAAALMLYVEMLENGTTSVGEFHYVHHDASGAPYADVGEMAARVAEAATDAGIALTLLPVLYQTSDFDPRPLPEQRRFLCSTDAYLRLVERCAQLARVGIAPHSPARGAARGARRHLDAFPAGRCTSTSPSRSARSRDASPRGARPVAWLLEHADVDERWCLVHATHLDDARSRRIADSRAIVGSVRPRRRTSATGSFRSRAFLAAGGRFGIGSDSQVSVAPGEELRLLEVGQRLAAVGRATDRFRGTSARRCSRARWRRRTALGSARIGARARADFVVLDDSDPGSWPRNGHAPRRARVRDLAVSDPRGAGRRTDRREGRTTSRSRSRGSALHAAW
jgi:formimidoylglutamate deiminase